MKAFLLLGILFIADLSYSQVDQLAFSKEQWPENTVVHYRKTNWDGSNEGFISVYFKDKDWIESVKWHEGASHVSIIPAKIDHRTFSVHHFKNIQCNDGTCNQVGEMVKDQTTGHYLIDFGAFKDTIRDIPEYWHSYDFDWASLMAAFLFKKEHSSHQFERCDFFMEEGKPKFGPYDQIRMDYKGKSTKMGKAVHLYTIDGPGLNKKGGEIWFDAESSLLLGYKIETPDEDSYQNVDFQYIKKETMTPAQWEAFKKTKWSK